MSDDKILIDKKALQLLVKPTLMRNLEFYLGGEGSAEEILRHEKETHAVLSCCPRDAIFRWGMVQPTPRHASLDFQNTTVRKEVPESVRVSGSSRSNSPKASNRDRSPTLYPKAGKSVKKLYAVLIDNPAGLTANQLVEMTGFGQKTVQNLLRALAARKLIRRTKIRNPSRGSRLLCKAVVP